MERGLWELRRRGGFRGGIRDRGFNKRADLTFDLKRPINML